MVCRPCNDKLRSFYEYYLFVLENQKQQQRDQTTLVTDQDNLTLKQEPKPDAIFLPNQSKTNVIKCEPDIGNIVQEDEGSYEDDGCRSDEESNNEVPVKKRVAKTKKVKVRIKRETVLEKVSKPRFFRSKCDLDSQEEQEDILIRKYFSFDCDQCDSPPAITSYREFKKHMSERHKTIKKRFLCCDMEFSTRKTIIRHCQDHENPISCMQCSFTALNKIHFLQHMSDIHDVKLRMPSKKHDVALYTCNECGKQLIGKHKIKGHLLQVHFHNVHICETCAVVYKTHNSLQNHIKREHLGIKEPRRQCPQCGNWVQESSLPTHIKNHQIERIKLSCKICSKEFMGKKNLQRHVREKHTERAFKFRCTFCAKSFSQEKKLNEHVATHTGVPLYECEFCSAVFNSCGNFAAHKRKLHPVEYEQQKLMNKVKREQAPISTDAQ